MADTPEKPGPDEAEEQPGPDEASGAARRRHPRANLSILVQYRFDTFDEFLGEYASDISLGGMFIRTDEPRPEGSMIYLQFALKDGSTLIEGLGRVVHVNPKEGDRPAGMGVEFLNFDDESETFIENLVAGHLERDQATGPEPDASPETGDDPE